MPIIATDLGTHDTATALTNRPRPPRTRTRRARSPPPSRCSTSTSTATRCSTGSRWPAPTVVTPLMFEHQLIDRARRRPPAHRAARGRRRPDPAGRRHRCCAAASPTSPSSASRDEVQPRAAAARRRHLAARGCSARTTRSCASGSPRSTTQRRKHKGIDLERGPRHRHRRVLLRHDDGRARPRRRHGVGRGAHHRAHHPAGARGRPDACPTSRSCRRCSSCACATRCSSTATARSTPTRPPTQLADIAIASARTAAAFGIEPRVAMLSYSTGSSGTRRRRREGHARRPRWCASARPTCSSRDRSSTTPPSTPPSRATKLPGLPGRRAGDGVRLPRPQHRQQHLQGGAALGRRASRSARSCRACASRSTTCPAARTVRDIVNTVAITAIQAQGRLVSGARSWSSTPARRR